MVCLPWAIILAGGDGTRLRSLTQRITGDDRPKQFCPIFDGETLLERTRHRADLVTRPDRQVVVVTRRQEPYWRRLAAELHPHRLVVQPWNGGTAAAILYALLRVRDLGGDVPVLILPSDHDVAEEIAFMSHVRSALAIVEGRPGQVLILGIEAEYPESEYGWIEPGTTPLDVEGAPAFPIRRFWEKPSERLARVLWSRGCLWNSFVMVGRVSAFLGLVCVAAPELLAAFEPIMQTIGAPPETSTVERVYAALPTFGFSEAVLARAPGRLATIRVKDVGWSDLGNPTRVLASLRRSGRRPAWLSRIELAPTA
jgi:mannose-1-phosphate guanylyltransferase